MSLVSPSQSNPGDEITAARINNPVNQIAAVVNGNIDSTNIAASGVGTSQLAASAVTATKVNFGGSGSGIWWEEVGRTTNSAQTSIAVTVAARKYLKVIAHWKPSTTSNSIVQFNSDTAANYSRRDSTNGGADGAAGSLTSVIQTSNSGTPTTLEFEVLYNVTADEKIVMGWSVEQNTAGAANGPFRREHAGKWANTSAQITTITITPSAGNLGTADLIVLGHD